jgi:hypothetical protein
MENLCFLCEQPIQEGQVRSELPCHHFLHTMCLINRANDHWAGEHFLCQCGEIIIQATENNVNFYDEEEEGDIPNNETGYNQLLTTIRNLYNTDTRFKGLLRNIKKKRSVFNKACRGLHKLIKEKKAEVRTQLLSIQSQLEGITGVKKAEIRSSAAYKDFMLAKRSYNACYSRLQHRYGYTASTIREALSNVKGFRNFRTQPRWRESHYYLMSRPWRYYVHI